MFVYSERDIFLSYFMNIIIILENSE